MPQLSRTQVLVYGAVAVALLLVGARAIRGEGSSSGSYSSASYGDSGSYSDSESYSDSGSGEEAGGTEEGGESSGEFTVSGEGSDVVVDVTGAVAKPGVYRLPAGSRVTDAVQRAGGASGRAELEAVNLAARLADGQQVVIPERVPGGGTPGAAVTAGAAASEEGPISLGTATVEELDTIDGIGPVTAGDIVEFREAHGGLSSVEQLDQVSGIGPATMSALRERLQP